MGLHNEYSGDAFNGEDASVDMVEEKEEIVLDEESWEDWHSQHLLNMWMGIRGYLEANGMDNLMLQNATYHEFLQFVHDFSS